MLRMSPLRQTKFWGGIGLAMMIVGFFRPWFILELRGFRFPLGILVLLYAGLQFVLHLMTRSQVLITKPELDRYGKALELATPLILDLLAKGRSIGWVAESVEKEHSIPPDVTKRYTIILLKTLKHEQKDLLVPHDEE